MLRHLHSMLRLCRFGCVAMFARVFGANVRDQLWTWFN
jgi:hypothetical protein